MSIFRKYWGVSDAIKKKEYEGFMERFPILFQNKDRSAMETCMCWGIECPIGWYHILEQLCTELEYSNLESVPKWGMAIVADQVKEKYGTLRFYFNVRDVDENGKVDFDKKNEKLDDAKSKIVSDHLFAFAQNLIDEAEHMTEETCADCGTPLTPENTVETKGWVSYICKECDEQREIRRQEYIESQAKLETNKVNEVDGFYLAGDVVKQ